MDEKHPKPTPSRPSTHKPSCQGSAEQMGTSSPAPSQSSPELQLVDAWGSGLGKLKLEIIVAVDLFVCFSKPYPEAVREAGEAQRPCFTPTGPGPLHETGRRYEQHKATRPTSLESRSRTSLHLRFLQGRQPSATEPAAAWKATPSASKGVVKDLQRFGLARDVWMKLHELNRSYGLLLR